MIYDKYEMAVLYRLSMGPRSVSELYCNISQKRKLDDMFDAELIHVTPAGIDLTYTGDLVFKQLLGIAKALGSVDYIDESAHIDKMNRRRREYMQSVYHSRR